MSEFPPALIGKSKKYKKKITLKTIKTKKI